MRFLRRLLTGNGMDTVSEARLMNVHPLLAEKIKRMAVLLAQEGITIRVTQGLRTWEEQDALYAKGRTDHTPPDQIVTNAPAGSSWHNYGLAVDVAPMTNLGPDWNVGHPAWQRIVAVGTTLGLESGSVWRTFPDWPHFQLTGKLPLSPPPAIRNALVTQGIPAVWDMTGYVIST
jgi:peptidoglycan L-alanyl-D-glutamate endopeptidase CwlK